MITLTLLLALSSPVDDLAHALVEQVTIPASRPHSPAQWGYCRRSPGGCQARMLAFAEAFVGAGEAYGVDPWLLAAVAWEESRLNPAADGSRGEAGVMQIHPGHAAIRATRYYREREKCLALTHACQAEVIAVGAEMLARSIAQCGGSEWRGVAVYHTGARRFCQAPEPGPYVRRVYRWREELLNGRL